jgi:hypothetical protein
MSIRSVFNSVAVSPRELVSKKFWTSFEYAPIDKWLPTHNRVTFFIRCIMAACFSIAFYFFVDDMSGAGILRDGISVYVSVGTFIVFMVILFNYENHKRIQRKVYT